MAAGGLLRKAKETCENYLRCVRWCATVSPFLNYSVFKKEKVKLTECISYQNPCRNTDAHAHATSHCLEEQVELKKNEIQNKKGKQNPAAF